MTLEQERTASQERERYLKEQKEISDQILAKKKPRLYWGFRLHNSGVIA
eukprot:CAMPEP_0184671142 /NCGR_PEP_ID=MMETSP0308-20130426/85328_1 /TAXON_ID=38269 /ORGANISM="Gloeochaete witrockiana, Strain SAG 46.84" /LENGTH=48 /DNA_ID= /DNA_START= /DNA_END= /DNA_ORIENTATION=